MNLFELAMELGVRSADMADAAPSLGFEGITPTSVLTPDQVQAFRARYAPAAAPMPGPSNAYPGVQTAAPSDWAAPPPLPTAPAGGSGGGGGGMGRVLPIVAVGAVVVAVIGLFAFMAANGGTDEERMDQIAAAEPQDTMDTGPDGKPLTKEERADIAAWNAAKAANMEKACSALRKIRNADIALSNAADTTDTLAEYKALLIHASNQSVAIYDETIPDVPEQADNLRRLQQYTREMIPVVEQSGDGRDLVARLEQFAQQGIDSGAIQAAQDLDGYAMKNCGFSTGNN